MNSQASKILYIDDDEGLCRLVKKALGRRGYEVQIAYDGPSGVGAATAGQFDLIAVDHYMPGQDGLSTLEALKALPDAPPIIYVTGSEESRIAVAALKAGAVDYVVKTVDDDFYDLLASAISQALEQIRLREGKAQVEAELRAANLRLEALLQEVNHRVANSLQLVSAFVHMQTNALADGPARAALKDVQRRIAAIIQVHRRLYTSTDIDAVEMDEYLQTLLKQIEDTWSTPAAPRHIVLSTQAIRLQADQAVSIGVIVNELVSNACKYAYPADSAGEVRVDLRLVDDRHARLVVEDDGCGIDPGAAAKGTGLGSKLIDSMAQSLHSAVQYEAPSRGVRTTLQFSL